MKIEGKLVFKKEGDKKASEFLNEFVKDEGKKIKLTVPFEASGTFEKTPTQPDGITPIIVNEPNFSGGSGDKLEEIVKPKVESKKEKKKEVKKSKKK